MIGLTQVEEVKVLTAEVPADDGDVVRAVCIWRAGVTVVSGAKLPKMDFGSLAASDPYGV